MTYEVMRSLARNGDVLLCRTERMGFIRIATGESVQHVAVLIWLIDGLWVFEFVENVGFQAMPASQWFDGRTNQTIFFGIAPEEVRGKPEVFEAAVRYRNVKFNEKSRWERFKTLGYGWVSLLKVWASQVTGKRVAVVQKVCSTFAQEIWEAPGYKGFVDTADPGNFTTLCQSLHIIER